jgi:hypothetical protein
MKITHVALIKRAHIAINFVVYWVLRQLVSALWALGRASVVCVLLLLSLLPVQAQGLRDPTVAPAAAGIAESGTQSHGPELSSGSIAVIVRNGVHYLVLDTRLYARGQLIGPARIERITETEVWLRENGNVRKVPIFSGIERHPTPDTSLPKTPGVSRPVVKP